MRTCREVILASSQWALWRSGMHFLVLYLDSLSSKGMDTSHLSSHCPWVSLTQAHPSLPLLEERNPQHRCFLQTLTVRIHLAALAEVSQPAFLLFITGHLYFKHSVTPILSPCHPLGLSKFSVCVFSFSVCVFSFLIFEHICTWFLYLFHYYYLPFFRDSMWKGTT